MKNSRILFIYFRLGASSRLLRYEINEVFLIKVYLKYKKILTIKILNIYIYISDKDLPMEITFVFVFEE